jgi:hypothetical protein
VAEYRGELEGPDWARKYNEQQARIEQLVWHRHKAEAALQMRPSEKERCPSFMLDLLDGLDRLVQNPGWWILTVMFMVSFL